jgi:hypothetical protein
MIISWGIGREQAEKQAEANIKLCEQVLEQRLEMWDNEINKIRGIK